MHGREIEAQWSGEPAGQKENTAETGGEKYSLEGEVKDSSGLTEEDLMHLLELVETGQLFDDSYIPLRASTPQFLIDVVREHSKGKLIVKNLPMASKVRHVAQNMEEDDGSSYGDERPHGFDKNDIVTISKEMGHPSYITLQENGRYAEVVSFYNSRRKRVIVAISFADDKKNYKHKPYMNGYNEGYYNIIVTQYEPDNFKSYLDSCEIVYDKQKMNGKYQVGSGRVVTFTHDTPFVGTVSKKVETVKQQIQAVFDKVSPNHAEQMERYTELKDSDSEAAQRFYDGLMETLPDKKKTPPDNGGERYSADELIGNLRSLEIDRKYVAYKDEGSQRAVENDVVNSLIAR